MTFGSIKEEMRRERLREEAVKEGIPRLRGIDDEKAYLSWLGGFFDGEGCVTILRGKKTTGYPYYHTLKVEIGGNFKEILEEIEKRFGGTLSQKSDSSKFAWRLQLSAKKALHFLEIIQPYVRLKHEEVETGIEFQRHKITVWPDSYGEIERQESLLFRIQFLNKVRNTGDRVN